jgi:hypothetical protein
MKLQGVKQGARQAASYQFLVALTLTMTACPDYCGHLMLVATVVDTRSSPDPSHSDRPILPEYTTTSLERVGYYAILEHQMG